MILPSPNDGLAQPQKLKKCLLHKPATCSSQWKMVQALAQYFSLTETKSTPSSTASQLLVGRESLVLDVLIFLVPTRVLDKVRAWLESMCVARDVRPQDPLMSANRKITDYSIR